MTPKTLKIGEPVIVMAQDFIGEGIYEGLREFEDTEIVGITYEGVTVVYNMDQVELFPKKHGDRPEDRGD